MLDSLELESWLVVSFLTWVLGSDGGLQAL